MKTYHEITPLNEFDCFTIFSREKKEFNFPLHTHQEYELNLICNAGGAKRIIGNHVSEIPQIELVLVAGNLPHGWFTHHCTSTQIQEITIQFHKDLFDGKLLNRNQFKNIRIMLVHSENGILFSQETAQLFKPRLQALVNKRGLTSVLELIAMLDDLSFQSSSMLCKNTLAEHPENFNSRRIEKAFEYIRNNYNKQLTLKDISREVNMPEVSFSRFIKKRTGRTFIEILNGTRLSHTTRLLMNTTQSVAEVAYSCGFNNLSYFNRIFKKNNNCTPMEYRVKIAESKIYI